jgi:hypothetical protein
MKIETLCIPAVAKLTFGLALLFTVCANASAQAIYPSPEDAAAAMADAVAISDDAALKHVLGAQYPALFPQGVDQQDVYGFLSSWAQHHSILLPSKGVAQIEVGNNGWTFPIPMRQVAKGWQFDLGAGKLEVQRRTLGRNELGALDTLRQLADAQQGYARQSAGGVYAAKLISTPGKTDGLYWPAVDGAAESPIGLSALAMTPDTPAEDAYNGYHYRVYPAAQSGYALEAWPARPGVSGLHSFVRLGNGDVYQRAAAQGAADAAAIKRLAGGDAAGWEKVSMQ